MLDANREPKFSWTGPVENPHYWKNAGLALLVGILLSLPILQILAPTAMQALVLSIAANAVGAWAATIFAYQQTHYFVWGSAFALTLGCILLIPLILIALARVDEIAAIAFGQKPLRLLTPERSAALLEAANAEKKYPKVSIHIPAYREQPEMLKLTLDAVAALDYPNFECVVIINNTPDPAYWQPIQDHCRMLGERFIFINAEKVEGFKARRATHRHGSHRSRCRSDRHHRCRLRCRTELADRRWSRPSTIRASVWCRRRRITATKTRR